MSEEEKEEMSKRIIRYCDKIFTMFDNENVSDLEGVATLCTCLSDSFFMDCNLEHTDSRLEMVILALRKSHAMHKEKLLEIQSEQKESTQG